MFDTVFDMQWFAPFIVLCSIALAVVISQSIKFFRNPGYERPFLRDGGMPSTHATIIGSSLSGIFLVQGLSMLFVLACAVGLIILRDAFGVRYAVGENAKVLKRIAGAKHVGDVVIDEGHTPVQILVGFLLGVFVSASVLFAFGISFFVLL